MYNCVRAHTSASMSVRINDNSSSLDRLHRTTIDGRVFFGFAPFFLLRRPCTPLMKAGPAENVLAVRT
jgi:hypothetical protein